MLQQVGLFLQPVDDSKLLAKLVYPKVNAYVSKRDDENALKSLSIIFSKNDEGLVVFGTKESLSLSGALTKEDEEMARSALSTFMAKEKEIQKRKIEVQERVLAQMGRIEQENRICNTFLGFV